MDVADHCSMPVQCQFPAVQAVSVIFLSSLPCRSQQVAPIGSVPDLETGFAGREFQRADPITLPFSSGPGSWSIHGDHIRQAPDQVVNRYRELFGARSRFLLIYPSRQATVRSIFLFWDWMCRLARSRWAVSETNGCASLLP